MVGTVTGLGIEEEVSDMDLYCREGWKGIGEGELNCGDFSCGY